MSREDSLKRKSTEGELENASDTLDEPKIKLQKIDTEASDPNLKNDDAQETNLNEFPCENAIKEFGPVQSENAEYSVNGGVYDIQESEVNVTPQVVECVDGANQEQPSQSCSSSISIKFNDQTVVAKYKSKIVKFFDSFLEFQVRSCDELSLEVHIDDDINVDDWVMVEACELESVTKITETVDTHENSSHPLTDDDSVEAQSKKKHKKRSKVKKELFILDSTPSPSVAKADLRYTTKFTISTEKEDVNSERPSKQGCFNCGQFHALKDCPQPRDYNRINLARQKFLRQQTKSRYHLEEEQKFNHLAPGKLSNELKKALGLYKNEAPHFIYLMRRLGYPPGWLEEAKFVHSDLEMFDIDGNFVKSLMAKQRGLDPDKIVDFPGFNVPFDKGIKDEFRKYGVPPYSDNFSKAAMIDYFDKECTQEGDNLETCDMDIDHEQEASLGQQERPFRMRVEKEDKACCDSPSLLDLEQQKQLLLEELKDESKEEKAAVKTTHFGTPILKSNSPFITLPDPDKFSKDVSPVINFENLPNSTGKYEQMTDVLQKVRDTLKKMQQKCDNT